MVGQERAIDALRHAAERPGHAYLLVGPHGSGVEALARGFAALLVSGSPEGVDTRVEGLVARGVFPDVVEFEPHGFSYRIKEDIRDAVIPEALRSPVESERKVLILHEAERLRGNQNECANALLKTLEEPPARTVIVLVTGTPDDLLPTIRSRCQRIDVDAVPQAILVAALERGGMPAEQATLAARLSGGNLARARDLAGRLSGLRHAFATAPSRLDGTGATAARVADDLAAVVEAAAAQVAERHQRELGEFDADMERHGYSDREATRMRRRLEERHKRETRRARIDLLLEGVTAIETVYRDALVAPADPLNADLPLMAVQPRAAAAAFDACRRAREAFMVNEKGLVQLQHLLCSLPPAALTGV